MHLTTLGLEPGQQPVASLCVGVTSLKDTQKIAASLASVVNEPGDIVLLYGPVGVGKTTFAQGFIRGLVDMPTLPVASPTFTIIASYDHAGRTYHHMDLYRIRSEADMRSLKLHELFRKDVSIVEWSDRLHGTKDMPDSYVRITITEPRRASALKDTPFDSDKVASDASVSTLSGSADIVGAEVSATGSSVSSPLAGQLRRPPPPPPLEEYMEHDEDAEQDEEVVAAEQAQSDETSRQQRDHQRILDLAFVGSKWPKDRVEIVLKMLSKYRIQPPNSLSEANNR